MRRSTSNEESQEGGLVVGWDKENKSYYTVTEDTHTLTTLHLILVFMIQVLSFFIIL